MYKFKKLNWKVRYEDSRFIEYYYNDDFASIKIEQDLRTTEWVIIIQECFRPYITRKWTLQEAKEEAQKQYELIFENILEKV